MHRLRTNFLLRLGVVAEGVDLGQSARHHVRRTGVTDPGYNQA